MSEATPTPTPLPTSTTPHTASTSHSTQSISKTVKVKFYVGDEEVGMLLLAPKDFSTGSSGYFANGKVALADDAEKGYQVQVQMVRIGSKLKKKA